MATGDDDRPLSDEVLMLAARAQARAAGAPGEAEIRNLAAEALAHGKGTTSAADVGLIMDQAIEQAHEVRRLLHRLTALTSGGDGP